MNMYTLYVKMTT